MSARNLRWVLSAGVVAGLAFVIFFPRPYKPMVRPSDRSFDGRWVLDPASVPSVAKRTGRTPARSEMVFGSDGTLTVIDMPYEEPRRSPEFALVSGRGRWRLSLQQDWVMTFTLDEQRGGTLFIELKGGKPSALTYGVVDPDSSERWIWRRAASEAP